MSKGSELYLDDILEAIRRVELYADLLYAGVDLRIVWDVVVSKLPPLKPAVQVLRSSLDAS